MALTDYAGIDYSLGKSNFDKDTGIHYGVIPANEIGQVWYDESEPYYGDIECPKCNETFDLTKHYGECPYCEYDTGGDEIYPISFYYEDNKYSLEQSHDDTDVWVFKSPYYTYCQYCSPCAPGAGYLMNYMKEGEGIKTYCLPGEFFDSDRAPYFVYEVETDKLINPLKDKVLDEEG